MKHLMIAGAFATTLLLAGGAMAQSLGEAPSYQTLQHGTYGNGTPGTEFTQTPGSIAGGYSPQWSANPGDFNAFTSQPGFVEHSHGNT
jgi:hypothetical protein